MKLNWIENIKPTAARLDFGKGVLFTLGSCNLGWTKVAETLAAGKFPDSIRGSFAFSWTDESGTVAAVDHVGTFPLFYSESEISNVFFELLSRLQSRKRNSRAEFQIKLLGGHTFGSETTDCGISRLQPGHYLKDSRQHSYVDFFDYPGDEDLDEESFRSLVETSVERSLGERNTLLLSGGTDSTALAGILKKKGFLERFAFVHAWSSNQPWTEKHLVEKIAQEMQLQVKYADIAFSGDTLPEQSGRQYSFWIENPFSGKKMAIRNSGEEGARVMTGELGDQLFGGPKNSSILNWALQAREFSEEQVARIWINQSVTYGKHGGTLPAPVIRDLMRDSAEFGDVYEELVATISALFARMRTKDFLNRLLLLNYLVKGPYRAWAYSQDDGDWVHPFASWELFDSAFRLRSNVKIRHGGRSKSILLDLWRPYLSDLPWRVPKHGFGIPDRKKIRSASGHVGG